MLVPLHGPASASLKDATTFSCSTTRQTHLLSASASVMQRQDDETSAESVNYRSPGAAEEAAALARDRQMLHEYATSDCVTVDRGGGGAEVVTARCGLSSKQALVSGPAC